MVLKHFYLVDTCSFSLYHSLSVCPCDSLSVQQERDSAVTKFVTMYVHDVTCTAGEGQCCDNVCDNVCT